MEAVGVLVTGLLRFVRPLIVTCRGCLVVHVVCSANLARSAFFSKQMVISSCFVAERSCSGVGLGCRVASVLAKSPSHRAATNVGRRFGLESVSVRERKCSGESACRSLRR